MSFQQYFEMKVSEIIKACIITVEDCTIQFISQDLLAALGFEHEELAGKNMRYIAAEGNVFKDLVEASESRIGERHHLKVYGKSHQQFDVLVETFSSGLLFPETTFRVFRFISFSAVRKTHFVVANEIDDFVYKMSHDIRGPLATIMGLVNVLKLSPLSVDQGKVVCLLEDRAKMLDDRLFQLGYVARAGVARAAAPRQLNSESVKTRIAEFMRSHGGEPDQLVLDTDTFKISCIDEAAFVDLLENVLLFQYQLPKSLDKWEISIHLKLTSDRLFVKCEVTCANLEPHFLSSLLHGDFIFSDVLRNPKLLQYYAAKKIAARLNGHLLPSFRLPGIVSIVALLPI